jgi:hypothetical protein
MKEKPLKDMHDKKVPKKLVAYLLFARLEVHLGKLQKVVQARPIGFDLCEIFRHLFLVQEIHQLGVKTMQTKIWTKLYVVLVCVAEDCLAEISI